MAVADRYQDVVDAAAALETCTQACENCNCDAEQLAFNQALLALGEEIDQSCNENFAASKAMQKVIKGLIKRMEKKPKKRRR